MFAGESFALQQDDVEARAGEQGGGGAASGASSYDYDVGVFGDGHSRYAASITQRKPRLPVELSGVLELRAATLYRLQ